MGRRVSVREAAVIPIRPKNGSDLRATSGLMGEATPLAHLSGDELIECLPAVPTVIQARPLDGVIGMFDGNPLWDDVEAAIAKHRREEDAR